MILNSIELKNFRLHSKTKLKFSNYINYIIGGNGQGKTTLLESIYYLCTTKSLNQTSDSEALKFGEKFFEINGSFTEHTRNKIKIFFESETNKKSIFLNDKQIYKASEFIGNFPVVALLQSDHAITQGSPAERRRFVDSIISQASATYLKLLLEYSKTLRHRSSLLTKIKERNSTELFDQLEAWTSSLVSIGSEVIKHRNVFVKEFNDFIKKSYKQIMNEQENPAIKYKSLNFTNDQEIKKDFLNKLNEVRNDELRRARNLVGPHRDDFEFFIDDLELKKFGSQGQHKTFQIALRFSQFFYLQNKLGKKPIFLMDDVFGELDTYRAEKISNYLSSIGQAFITMTDFSKLENLTNRETDLMLTVEKGNVTYA